MSGPKVVWQWFAWMLVAVVLPWGCASAPPTGVDRAEVNRIVGAVLSGQAIADPREKLAALAELENFLITTPNRSERLARITTQLADLYMDIEVRTYERALRRISARGEDSASLRPDHRRSIALYRKVLTDYPGRAANAGVYYQLARAFDDIGEETGERDALEAFLKVVPKGPQSTEVRYRLGELAFETGRFQRASEQYAGVLADRDAPPVLRDYAAYKRVWALFLSPDYPVAVPAAVAFMDEKRVRIGKTLVLDSQTMPEPDWERVREVNGILARMLHDQGGVKALLKAFPEERDYLPMVYGKLAEVTITYESPAAAVPVYEAFLKRYPDSPDAPVFVGYIVDRYTEGQNLESAIRARVRLVEEYGPQTAWWRKQDAATRRRLGPVFEETSFRLARHYHSVAQQSHKKEDYARAVDSYRTFLSRFKNGQYGADAPEAAFLLGELLFETRDFAGAASAYEQSAYDFPVHQRSAEAAYAMVYAREQGMAGMDPDGLQFAPHLQLLADAFLRLVEQFPREPRLPTAYERIAALCFSAGDYARLYDISDRVVRFGPRSRTLHAKAWRALGEAALEIRKLDQADTAFRQALTYLDDDPGQKAEVHKLLAAATIARAEAESGDGAVLAVQLLEASATLPASDPLAQSARLDAGLSFLRAEEFGQALAVFGSLLASWPNTPHRDRVARSVLNVGERAQENGDLEAARRAWERYRQWFEGEWPERDLAVARLEGRALMDAGDLEGADAAFVRAIASQPKGQAPEEVLDMLSGIRYKRAAERLKAKKPAEAARLFGSIADDLAGSRLVSKALEAQVSALEAAGDAAGALESAERLLADFPGEPPAEAVHAHLGELLLAAGQPVEAGMHYQLLATQAVPAEADGLQMRAVEIFEGAKRNDLAVSALSVVRDRHPAGSDPWMSVHQQLVWLQQTGKRAEPKSGSRDADRVADRLLADLLPLAESDSLEGGGRRIAAEILLTRARDSRARLDRIRLVPPLDQSLEAKKTALKESVDLFSQARDLRALSVTPAASRNIGEMFEAFAVALLGAPVPDNLTPEQVEIYRRAVEKKAKPYRQRAIQAHQDNLERAREGVLTQDVLASMQALGRLSPEWYDRPEIPMQPVYVP
ncbi:MAG: tetratricopeptide repeat protein [Nitrospirota bacterium]|nr:tetratricopeptide repeat protein [Nitrospirota bacterium]